MDGRYERSALDILITSTDLVDYIESMKIYEERVTVLTKIIKNKKGDLIETESDHNI